ncbi:hypothetical protein RT97_06505 [Variovorax paradoxus]|uniref:Uncharacterized protein n=1 Tax=Variovorax paradoxus TaxID=34073 RepID=A0A0D0LZ57_VARPD|nr:hypothetical protein RT97_06505 [Variovorax paradoxus]
MEHSDEVVIADLQRGGIAWRRYFVLNGLLPCYENEAGQLMAHIIEDDSLARATKDFLVRQGQVRTLPTKS